ncbi:MAG: hypothetical protein ACW97P_03545 [Candidatus Hodarchaeales archaeon]|jgi:hypothetical protein
MAAIITSKKDYILVEPTEGVDYLEIWEGFARILIMPEYLVNNDIWVFHEGPIRLSYGDLYKIRDFIKKHYPENSTRNKTAIVVEKGFQKGLAEVFANIVEDLPFEMKVFSDIQSAELWVKS